MTKQESMAQDRRQPSSNTPLTDDLAVAGVVHDMNQLFGVIMGRVGKMIDTDPDPEMRSDLEAILLATKDAASMIQRLQGSQEQSEESQPLDKVVAQAVLLAGSDEDRRKWPVSTEVPANTFSTMSGQVIREVLNNLVRNAQGAMPQGGNISITAHTGDDHIQLLVQDQGPGLAPGVASQVFDVGFTTSGQEGRGVGLPASRALMQSCAGDLNHVPAPGKGAVFEMIIPLGSMQESAGARASGHSSEVSEKVSTVGTTVLVVDDDQAMREMLADVLGTMGCTVVTAKDARGALDVFASHPFQIALLDQNLPGLKGMELAVKLRELDHLLTMILVTGWGNEDIGMDSADAALDLIARKPLEFGTIRCLIGDGLNIRHEKEQLHLKEPSE